MYKMHDNSAADCSICMDPLDNTVTTFKCNHQFHSKCILEYCLTCKNEIICPLCRVSIAKVPVQPQLPNQYPSLEQYVSPDQHVTILLPLESTSTNTSNNHVDRADGKKYCKLVLCTLPFLYLGYVLFSIIENDMAE